MIIRGFSDVKLQLPAWNQSQYGLTEDSLARDTTWVGHGMPELWHLVCDEIAFVG